jgi:hypothetical protein
MASCLGRLSVMKRMGSGVRICSLAEEENLSWRALLNKESSSYNDSTAGEATILALSC